MLRFWCGHHRVAFTRGFTTGASESLPLASCRPFARFPSGQWRKHFFRQRLTLYWMSWRISVTAFSPTCSFPIWNTASKDDFQYSAISETVRQERSIWTVGSVADFREATQPLPTTQEDEAFKRNPDETKRFFSSTSVVHSAHRFQLLLIYTTHSGPGFYLPNNTVKMLFWRFKWRLRSAFCVISSPVCTHTKWGMKWAWVRKGELDPEKRVCFLFLLE